MSLMNARVDDSLIVLSFSERVRGVVARRGIICVSLLRKVVAFEYGLSADGVGKGKSKMTDRESDGFWIKKFGEWETAKNEQGESYDEVDSTTLIM